MSPNNKLIFDLNQDTTSIDQESQKATKKRKTLYTVDVNKSTITDGAKSPLKGICNRSWCINWKDPDKSLWIKGMSNFYNKNFFTSITINLS